MEPGHNEQKLEKSIGPVALWGLGVGYVISGMYFGWNLGLAEGGSLGMFIAVAAVIVLYITFVFTYAELACAIPKAGGAFDYAMAAFGKPVAFIVGIAQWLEFVAFQPAIAYAAGSHLQIFFPEVPVLTLSIFAYLLFTFVNAFGVKFAVSVELFITVVAVVGLLLFGFLALPHFSTKNLAQNALPNGYCGVFAALPYALWFFMAIEGVANVAEETLEPQKVIIRGFGSALATLIGLCLLTFFASVGVAGWHGVVYKAATGVASDSPLPLVLSGIASKNSAWVNVITVFGLFGLLASLHGTILAGARGAFELGRYGYLPRFAGVISVKFNTPVTALFMNTGIGVLLLLTGKTADIIVLSCFGALTLYVGSSAAQMKLRKVLPQLHRPFKVPFYPYFPAVALLLSFVCLAVISFYYWAQALVYLCVLGLSFVIFKLLK